MVFEHIEKLKQEYTDKFVVVDEERPELRRFKGMTGTVRTVNMNGKALVEFDAYLNIGWYDIDVDYLSIVDRPAEKTEAKSEAKKPAAKKEAAPKKDAAPTNPGKMSVEEMLAAARGKAPAKPKAKSAPAPASTDPSKMSVAEMLAAARGEKSGGGAPAAKAAPAESSGAGDEGKKKMISQVMEAKREGKPESPAPSAPAPSTSSPKKLDPTKMSVAEMLAAARGEKSGGKAPAAEPAPAVEESVAEESAPAPAAEPTEESAGGGSSKRDEITEVADQVAYCRKVDAS